MLKDSVTVRAPATSGNLGAGFDALGLALDISNTISVARSDRPSFVVRGEGAGELSERLVAEAMAAVFSMVGQPLPSLAICEQNDIPVGRGLGSSAAAIVSSLVAANELSGANLSRGELLQLAARLEGHPDNVAPALLGGCQAVVWEGDTIVSTAVPLNIDLQVVLFVPDFAMPTEKTRAALSKEVSRQDAVFNIGRASLFVAAMATGRAEILRIATQDRLHQPARGRFFPAMDDIFQASLEASALAVFLSGGGPTVLALAQGREGDIAAAMQQAAARAGVSGHSRITQPSLVGTEVVAS